jgi:hypothetical protein
MKLNTKTGYVPLAAVCMLQAPISSFTMEEKCEAIDGIKEYLEQKPATEFSDKYLRTSSVNVTQEELLKNITENPVEIRAYRNSNKTFITSYCGVYLLEARLLKPIIVTMIPEMLVPSLMKCSIMEQPFPVDLLEVWTTADLDISKTLYGKIRRVFYEKFPFDVTLVRVVSKEMLFNSLFQTYSKPVFLSRSQEEAWKKSLWDEFKK